MRSLLLLVVTVFLGATFVCSAGAQTTQPARDYSHSSIVTRMMAFDKNQDGKLTRDEITDARLLRLFDEADVNKTGVVTPEDLAALAAKRDAEMPAGGQRRGGPGGFRGGPDGPRGFGGPGGPGMFPAPGQVLPPMLQEMLNLTPDQKSQIAELQQEVTARLAKILTPEQLKQLESLPSRGLPGDAAR